MSRMGDCRGGVVVLDSQGISLARVKGMDLRARAMRFVRAKGEGWRR